ncbi:protein kinase [Kribbella sp. NPDC026611]|uniref:serine/threonine-protein kinase n=1 Tax=Kribbella sp. NPDC026611 TaxID=3154911 RepID=UPI0033E47EAD
MEAFAGRYLLVDLVGTGGMGSVWRAWDLRRSTYVAAKVLGQHGATTLLRFVREQSLRIQHPHVVAPHGWAADDDKVVFAMDLVGGGSVATLLGDHGPLPESYVAVLLDQLLHGLSAVHAARVVHRDVKPANLLLDVTGTGRPHLRLSDFGVAGLLDEPRMTRHSTILGTPGYLAPEQLAGADPDPRQDLYSVGALAAELLTGERPTTSGTLPPVTGRLADFIHHCTAPDPTARPDSATTAGRLLAATGAVPPSPTTPWTKSPDPPEVFDQLPPFPPHWPPTNPQLPPPPSAATSAWSAAPTPADHLPAPTSAGPPASPSAVPSPGPTSSAPAASRPAAPTAAPTPSASITRLAPASPNAARPVEASPPSADLATTSPTAEPAVVLPTTDQSAGTAPAPSPDGNRRRLLWVVAGACFVGAGGLLGAAVWLLVR